MSIFKVQAISEFRSCSANMLSFVKGQEFFVLSKLDDAGLLFVSNYRHLPFADNAVSGLVPMSFFRLSGQQVSTLTTAANISQQTYTTSAAAKRRLAESSQLVSPRTTTNTRSSSLPSPKAVLRSNDKQQMNDYAFPPFVRRRMQDHEINDIARENMQQQQQQPRRRVSTPKDTDYMHSNNSLVPSAAFLPRPMTIGSSLYHFRI